MTEPLDPAVEARVRAAFDAQTMMTTVGARMQRLAPGECEIVLPFGAHIAQHHGYMHGGAIGMICDNACGFAALTLLPMDRQVVSAEYKINFLRPAVGERFVAKGRVRRAGKSMSVCEGEVEAVKDGRSTVIAVMLATMVAVPDEG